MQRIHIAIGTKNPCKIDAVRGAFHDVFASKQNEVEILISSHDVESGVPDQPFGDDETKQGAMNRAKLAYESAMKKSELESSLETMMPPDFGVGLEGGIEEIVDNGVKNLWCMAWMAVIGTNSDVCTFRDSPSVSGDAKKDKVQWGIAKTASFCLPQSISALVLNDGVELGIADDMIFKRKNSKQKDGSVGFLTRSLIDRKSYYEHALKLALIPFLRPEFYGDD